MNVACVMCIDMRCIPVYPDIQWKPFNTKQRGPVIVFV